MNILKRLGITILTVIGAISLLVLLVDKERTFVYATDLLKKEGIVLCPSKWHFDPLGGELENTVVALKNRPIARVGKVTIRAWDLHAKHIVPEGLIQDWIPGKIDFIEIKPIDHTLSAKGDFGRLEGLIDWRKKRVDLVLYPSSLMRRRYAATLSNFRYDKRTKVYRYALAF